MTRRTIVMPFLYAGPTPARWARAAALGVDASLSSVCVRQWHHGRVPVTPAQDRNENSSR